MSNANDADLTAYVGATGSGKTLLVRERLKKLYLLPVMIWSPKEAMDHYAPTFGRLVVGNPRELVDVAEAGSVVYAPPRDDDEVFAKHFDLFCGVAFELGNRVVLVEEMSLVANSRSSPARWRVLVTEGRARGLVLIATTQRPQECDSTLFDAATAIYCGRMQKGSSKRIMADAMDVPVERVRGLAPLQFLYWRVGAEQVEQVNAVPPKKPAAKRAKRR